MTRTWCAVFAAFALATAFHAGAADARKYAVLSALGDRFLVVNHDPEVGTRINRDRRESIELPPRAIDGAIALNVEKAIKREDASAQVVLLGASPALYSAQGEPSESPDVQPVVALVKPVLAPTGATHLVLITKLRHEALLKFRDGYVGSGKLDGLGFYLDHNVMTRASDTGHRGRGFIAPFAYFRVSLVDMATGTTIGHRDVVASIAISAARSPSLQAWQALTAEQKIRIITTLVDRESAAAVKSLVENP